ncbi:kelch-like protein 10 [Dreissena polymorpha]|uniref:kelch-like protein 10 n=1 Tax=Dreissena polymorpha TaxID=45954 RepID=UPI002263ED58|nr:kelch-like protein 10 [Dreissena polymorpha]
MDSMDWEDTTSGIDRMNCRLLFNSDQVLNELRLSGQLTDGLIKAGGQSFRVHRPIMSACSPYFRALFTNELFKTDRSQVSVPGISAELMKVIIEYAYTGRVEVDADNVEELLAAADQFHVMGIVKACSDFLTSELTPDNCIGIHKFAKAYFCHILERNSFKVIMYDFLTVMTESSEFLNLSADELADILSRDELNVKNEELVFDAVVRWIDFDPERRKEHMALLLRSMRLGLLTTHFFVEKVKPHPYVKDSDSCKAIVIDILKLLYDLDTEFEKLMDVETNFNRPRVPHEVLFAVGGWSGGSPTNLVETYDTRTDKWISVDCSNSRRRAYHGTACIGHRIYLVGGFDGNESLNSVCCFDTRTRTWSDVSSMNTKRCYVSVAVLDGFIYALGGSESGQRLNTAERYSPRLNQWSLIQPMNHQRSDASAAALNNRIYICGGFNGTECLNNCEYYDPRNNQWTMIAPMRNRRSGVAVAAYRGYLYALGGFNGISRMNTCERYKPATNSWTPVADMLSPRSNFATAVLDDMIFAIGGYNGITTITNVEGYDGCVDEWYDAAEMSVIRSALGACVVTGLSNIWDYISKKRELERGTKPRGQISKN